MWLLRWAGLRTSRWTARSALTCAPRPMLESKHPGDEMTEFLDTDGGQIAYDVTRQGPVVVLSHRMGEHRRVYRFLPPKLGAGRLPGGRMQTGLQLH
jgi:hypothetical protein